MVSEHFLNIIFRFSGHFCWSSVRRQSLFEALLSVPLIFGYFLLCLEFHLFAMDAAPVCVKFTGNNYSSWAFQFVLFLGGKNLWGHIDGTDVAPTSNTDKSKVVASSPSWVVLDARIMSWLLGSMEPHIITNLRAHRSAQSMWNYLKKVYHQDNDALHFQLEHAIAMFQHGSLSIHDYYSAFFTLWHEYTDLVTTDVLDATLSTI